jgi:hypothetical protein
MAGLPSYEEATTAPDWLELVASYVSFSDYRRLSLVSRRFWTIFAPRLWENPLKAVRLLGLDPSDGESVPEVALPSRAFASVGYLPTKIPSVFVTQR